jgi:tRNA acetyltransferase TAN1
MCSVVSDLVPQAVTLLTFVPVIFFKTRAPVEPVSFVRRICEDAAKHNAPKRTRFCNRLTPMTLMGKATEEGLEKTAKEVLASHFHPEPRVPTKVRSFGTVCYWQITNNVQFAIRPTIRNHTVMKRMEIIQKVASIVGPGHQVDLKNPDVYILVEIYTVSQFNHDPQPFFTELVQSICGISVVSNDYEALKRYNLAEIFEPSPKEQPKKKLEAPQEQPTETVNEKPDEKLETPIVTEEIEIPTATEETETTTATVGDEVAQV